MCGIIGGYSKQNFLNNFFKLKGLISHRGPDQKIEYFDNFFKINFYRLSIVNLKNTKTQPLINKNVSIFFNGEIYNYKEILTELNLKKDDNTFDGTVLPFLYERYGINFLDKINGMFAMVIYDKYKQKIYLCRDRFGEKPIYYSYSNDYLLFSSELTPLRKFLSKSLNHKNLIKYFSYGFIPSPNTLFQNIYKIPPGSYGEFDIKDFKFKTKLYYQISFGDKIFRRDDQIELRNKIKESYLLKSQREVRQTILLSSGLDSNIIKFTDKSIGGNTFNTSLGFEKNSYDETSLLKKVFKNEKIHFIKPKMKNYFNSFEEVYKKIDDLIYDQSLIPTYELFKNIKKNNFKLTFSGEGMDELLYGYNTAKANRYYEYLKPLQNNTLTKIIFKISNNFDYSDKYMSNFMKFNLFFKGLSENKEILQPSWLSPYRLEDINNLYGSNFNRYEIFDELYKDEKRLNFKNNYERYSYFYIRYYLTENLLVKSDRCSMLNSIENRCVYLDKNLFNFILSFDRKLNYKKFIDKNILRNIYSKDLDKRILSMNKHGFAFPVPNFLKNIAIKNKIKKNKLLLDFKKLVPNTNFRQTWGFLILDEHLRF